MSETTKFQTIAEAFKNAPLGNISVNTDNPSVIEGSIVINSGDALLIKGKQNIELDIIALLFPLSMTIEGDLFGGLRCVTPQNVVYISGRAISGKFFKSLSAIDEKFDRSRFRLISNDQLTDANRLQMEVAVHQQNILKGLKTTNGTVGVIVFDNTSSLIVSDPKDVDKKQFRTFIQKLMGLNVIQIWVSPDTKGANLLPEDLFDHIFYVEPDKAAENTALTVGCDHNGNLSLEKFTPIRLELTNNENGKKCLVEKGLINDRLVAIFYATTGKTQAQIGEFLEKDQSTISHWLRKAKEDGLINRNGNAYSLTAKGRRALPPMNM